MATTTTPFGRRRPRTGAAARISSPPPASGSRARCRHRTRRRAGQPIGGGTRVAGRQVGRRDVDDRHDLRAPSVARGTRYTATICSRSSVTSGRRRPAGDSRRRRRRSPGSMRATRCACVDHQLLPIAVVVAGDLFAEESTSSIGALNQRSALVRMHLAADDQHQHRRDQRHAEEHRHELGAKPGEREARRRSTISLMMLRASTNTSAASIVTSATESA